MWVKVGDELHNLDEITYVKLVQLPRHNYWMPEKCEVQAVYRDGTARALFVGPMDKARELFAEIEQALSRAGKLYAVPVSMTLSWDED